MCPKTAVMGTLCRFFISVHKIPPFCTTVFIGLQHVLGHCADKMGDFGHLSHRVHAPQSSAPQKHPGALCQTDFYQCFPYCRTTVRARCVATFEGLRLPAIGIGAKKRKRETQFNFRGCHKLNIATPRWAENSGHGSKARKAKQRSLDVKTVNAKSLTSENGQ